MPSWLAVAAGVAIGVAGTGIATNLSGDDTEQPARQVVAAADLDAFGDSGTPGTATVYRSPDGRVLELTLDSRAPGQGFREVWLLDAASGELVSLGVLNGTEATLSVPDGLELADYPVVDVSREPLNGDPAHSGDSIARGKLDQSDPEPDA